MHIGGTTTDWARATVRYTIVDEVSFRDEEVVRVRRRTGNTDCGIETDDGRLCYWTYSHDGNNFNNCLGVIAAEAAEMSDNRVLL